MEAVVDADYSHNSAAAVDAAEDDHSHTLPEEDTEIQTQTAAAEDDCIARKGQGIDAAAVAVVDADTDQGSPAHSLVVRRQAGAGTPDCSIRTSWVITRAEVS